MTATQESQPVEPARLRRAGVRRGGEHDFRYALQEIGGLGTPHRLLLQIEQDFLDDQSAEAMANENHRPGPQARFGQQNLENIDGPVLQRHRGAEPVGSRRFISQRIDRKPLDISRKPERPEGIVIGPVAPGAVDVAAKTVDKHHAGPEPALPACDPDDLRHMPGASRCNLQYSAHLRNGETTESASVIRIAQNRIPVMKDAPWLNHKSASTMAPAMSG